MDTLTSDPSQTLDHLISWAILNTTSLPASVDGVTPCDSQDGTTPDPYGPAPVLVNLSAKQAQERGLLTSGTYGHIGSTSFERSDLRSSLVNKLKQRLNTDGSILFKMTWKEKDTPSLRPVYLLRASAHPTSDNACGSWPSTTTNNHTGEGARGDGTPNLQTIAGWTTTTTRDHKDGPLCENVPVNSLLGRQVWLTGSPAQTVSGGQLRPGHSRWLMGYGIAWDFCGGTVMLSSRKSRQSSSKHTWSADLVNT